MTYSPTVRRKRLSTALRQLRRDAGLTAEDVARKAGWDPSKISRIESNDWKLPRVADIELLCGIYQVTPSTHAALVTLAKQARQRDWWEEFKDVLGEALPGLEAEAARIFCYQPLLVPGLLQTADYTRALCHASMLSDAETERRVEARQARQRVLEREHPPLLWVVLDESVLRKQVGGRRVMADQVQHLIDLSSRGLVHIQVLMDSVGAHAGMAGPIVLMHYENDPSIVYVEHAGTGDLYLEMPDEVTKFVDRYGHVMASASDIPASQEYLLRRLEHLKEGEDHDRSAW